MPGKILGLDISEDTVTAVQVLGGLKGYEVTACAQVMIEGDGGLGEALKGLFEQMDLKSDTCLSSIPAEQVSCRNLQMPFRETKKIRQTFPFEMETVVPFPLEDLLVDFTIIDRSEQSDVLGVSVKKAYISEFLEQLKACGIDPHVLDIRCVPTVSWLLKREGTPDNGLLLEIGAKRNTMILYLKRRVALIRTFPFDGAGPGHPISDLTNKDMDSSSAEQIESSLRSLCTRVQSTIHALGSQMNREVRPEAVFFTGIGALYPATGDLLERFLDIPSEQVNLRGGERIRVDKNLAKVWNPVLMDNALALALRDERRGQGFNFRKDEFEIKRHYAGLKKEIRKAALFLIIVLCLLIVDLGLDYYFLKKRYTTLDKNITQVFRKAFPDVKRIVDPLQQARVKLKEIEDSAIMLPGVKGKKGVLELLRDISERIPKSVDMHVSRMVVDPDTVRISGDTDTFNAVDNIKNGLEPSAHFSGVTITSANLDRTGKRVRFEMKLQREK
jgi:Tfp pilus assembly PilM family ATPase